MPLSLCVCFHVLHHRARLQLVFIHVCMILAPALLRAVRVCPRRVSHAVWSAIDWGALKTSAEVLASGPPGMAYDGFQGVRAALRVALPYERLLDADTVISEATDPISLYGPAGQSLDSMTAITTDDRAADFADIRLTFADDEDDELELADATKPAVPVEKAKPDIAGRLQRAVRFATNHHFVDAFVEWFKASTAAHVAHWQAHRDRASGSASVNEPTDLIAMTHPPTYEEGDHRQLSKAHVEILSSLVGQWADSLRDDAVVWLTRSMNDVAERRVRVRPQAVRYALGVAVRARAVQLAVSTVRAVDASPPSYSPSALDSAAAAAAAAGAGGGAASGAGSDSSSLRLADTGYDYFKLSVQALLSGITTADPECPKLFDAVKSERGLYGTYPGIRRHSEAYLDQSKSHWTTSNVFVPGPVDPDSGAQPAFPRHNRPYCGRFGHYIIVCAAIASATASEISAFRQDKPLTPAAAALLASNVADAISVLATKSATALRSKGSRSGEQRADLAATTARLPYLTYCSDTGADAVGAASSAAEAQTPADDPRPTAIIRVSPSDLEPLDDQRTVLRVRARVSGLAEFAEYQRGRTSLPTPLAVPESPDGGESEGGGGAASGDTGAPWTAPFDLPRVLERVALAEADSVVVLPFAGHPGAGDYVVEVVGGKSMPFDEWSSGGLAAQLYDKRQQLRIAVEEADDLIIRLTKRYDGCKMRLLALATPAHALKTRQIERLLLALQVRVADGSFEFVVPSCLLREETLNTARNFLYSRKFVEARSTVVRSPDTTTGLEALLLRAVRDGTPVTACIAPHPVTFCQALRKLLSVLHVVDAVAHFILGLDVHEGAHERDRDNRGYTMMFARRDPLTKLCSRHVRRTFTTSPATPVPRGHPHAATAALEAALAVAPGDRTLLDRSREPVVPAMMLPNHDRCALAFGQLRRSDGLLGLVAGLSVVDLHDLYGPAANDRFGVTPTGPAQRRQRAFEDKAAAVEKRVGEGTFTSNLWVNDGLEPEVPLLAQPQVQTLRQALLEAVRSEERMVVELAQDPLSGRWLWTSRKAPPLPT